MSILGIGLIALLLGLFSGCTAAYVPDFEEPIVEYIEQSDIPLGEFAEALSNPDTFLFGINGPEQI